MSSTRRERNTWIYSSEMEVLGGIWLNEPANITNTRFYQMCEIFLIFPKEKQRWRLYHLDGNNRPNDSVTRDMEEMKPGKYVVLGPSKEEIKVKVSTEEAVYQIRATSSPGASRDNQGHFRQSLMQRDKKTCAVSGLCGGISNPGKGLEAAHIFPRGRYDVWLRDNMERHISDQTPAEQIGPDGLYSAQNGLVMDKQVHDPFNAYNLTVDVHNGYRVVVFLQDTRRLGGNVLNISTRSGNPNHRASDALLRWHFRTGVLRWMRGP
ncbi:hypothetical protein BJX64DRAFT_287240 [Aspergillus heterothallicus]